MNVQGTRLILLTHLFSFKESLTRECALRFHIEILWPDIDGLEFIGDNRSIFQTNSDFVCT